MKRSERENRIDSPYNWQAHYKQGKADEEFTLYYTRCGLCELARARGHRDKTLGSGDDCCYYYMTKPGSEAERRWQQEHPDGTFTSK